MDAFFGPPCSYDTAGVVDLATFWNLPVISGVSTWSELDNKVRYATLTRNAFKASAMVDAMLAYFHWFGWQMFSLIDDSRAFAELFRKDIDAKVKINPNMTMHNFILYNFESVSEAVHAVSLVSRSKSSIDWIGLAG